MGTGYSAALVPKASEGVFPMVKRIIDWIRRRLNPTDFGPFGILIPDRHTGELRALQQEDLKSLEWEVNLLQEEFWSRVEVEAVRKYGTEILRMQ
jgi:hypothetical protein